MKVTSVSKAMSDMVPVTTYVVVSGEGVELSLEYSCFPDRLGLVVRGEGGSCELPGFGAISERWRGLEWELAPEAATAQEAQSAARKVIEAARDAVRLVRHDRN